MPTIANAKQTNPISPVISVPTKDKIPKLVTEITKEIPLPIMLSATPVSYTHLTLPTRSDV